MLSRVANNLFWMDRYMERSYGLLNLIITNYNSTLDSGDYSSWNGILKTYMNIDSLEDLYEYDDAISIIDFMLFDKLNPNTLINIIKKSRENARGVQEHISKEVWLSSNKFYLNISDRLIRKKFRRSDPIVFLEDLLNFNLMYYSNADLTQERGNAFGFMNLGKYYERTLQSVDFLSYRFNDLTKNDYALQESVFWKNLLLSIGGYQIYLKTYKSIFNVNNIVELISLNEFFPRSIKYSLRKLSVHVSLLNKYNNKIDNELLFHVKKLDNYVGYSSIESINEIELGTFLEKIKSDLNHIYSLITKTYFSQLY
ncbi:MAG: alpha-E domain-containing protein [Flavobacteriales bacterium]|nr:alpha-E domain-containing protein [Flavobacteriales bacterium]